MKNLILISFFIISASFIFGCSMGYNICIVNESGETLRVIVLREDFKKVNPRVMDLSDWKNNDSLLYILLKGENEWKELPKENIKEIPATQEITITLKPAQVLLYETALITSYYDENNPRGTAKQFRLNGGNGEVLLKEEKFYRQFEKGSKGIFFTYK
jgi:hypothetical protein